MSGYRNCVIVRDAQYLYLCSHLDWINVVPGCAT